MENQSDLDAMADALLASPVGPGVRRRLLNTIARVRARRLTPALGDRRDGRTIAAARRLLRGRGPEALS